MGFLDNYVETIYIFISQHANFKTYFDVDQLDLFVLVTRTIWYNKVHRSYVSTGKFLSNNKIIL